MMDKKKAIRKKVEAVKKEYLRFEIEQEKRIRALYDELSEKLEVAVTRAAEDDGKILKTNISDFTGKGNKAGIVRKLINNFTPKLLKLMRKSCKKTVDFSIRANEEGLSPYFRKNGQGNTQSLHFIKGRLNPVLTSNQKQAVKDRVIKQFKIIEEMDREIRSPYISILEQQQLELPLSDRVWNLTYQNEMQILQLLQAGIIQEKDAHWIAKQLRNYLVFPEELHGKWLKAFKVRKGVYKSAFKNAIRLQRSVMADVYRQADIDYCTSRKQYLKGMSWNLGPGNNCGECIDLATADMGLGPGIYPIDKCPQNPHPQ